MFGFYSSKDVGHRERKGKKDLWRISFPEDVLLLKFYKIVLKSHLLSGCCDAKVHIQKFYLILFFFFFFISLLFLFSFFLWFVYM